MYSNTLDPAFMQKWCVHKSCRLTIASQTFAGSLVVACFTLIAITSKCSKDTIQPLLKIKLNLTVTTNNFQTKLGPVLKADA